MNIKAAVFALLSTAYAIAPAAAQVAPSPVNVLTMRLICMGTGDHKVAQTAWGGVFGKHGSTSLFGGSTSQDHFDEQMDVDLKDGAGRARVPRRFLPPLHGGDGGWFDVKDLSVTDEEITGTVLINYANHPKMRIDRHSGNIAMDGKVGAFAGACKPYKADERAF